MEVQLKKSGAAPLEGRERWMRFGLLLVQLALLTLVVHRFEIEGKPFQPIMQLAAGGFVVHYFLPLRLRMPFFLLLSLAGIFIVLGLAPGALLVGLGLGLIGLCHLAAPMKVRVLLVVAAGGGLAYLRNDAAFFDGRAAGLWPILGSMFMFRLAVYLYDRAYNRAPAGPVRSLSYFFLLPNVCFPLFPVVDYETFNRTYYGRERHEIYQSGLQWIGRGVVQLLMYRVVYYHLTLAPSEVVDLPTFAQYAVAAFLLYLRVSGQFHVIVGILHLFGFDLPETHHRWLLASSFTDFWRRINIYWKDFMMKLFFYPAYFRLRRLGPTRSLVLATVYVFFATWLLHSYQWFWIRGAFPLTTPDMVFWGVLGVLVVVNSRHEMTHPRARRLSRGRPSIRASVTLSLKVAGTFSVTCVLWSLWVSSSMGEWFAIWAVVLSRPIALVGGLLAGALLAGAFGLFAATDWCARFEVVAQRWSPRVAVAVLALLLPLTAPGFTQGSPRLESLVHPSLSRLDAARLEQGYYEELTNIERFNSELWAVYQGKPPSWDARLSESHIARPTGDYSAFELLPDQRLFRKDAWIVTNRWGLVDRDCTLEPEAGVVRIAILGTSNVMATGVENDRDFESLLEDRLNQEGTFAASGRCEILNFGLSGRYPVRSLVALESQVLRFKPHILMFVGHPGDAERVVGRLAQAVENGIALPYPYLKDVVARVGAHAGDDQTTTRRALTPYASDILSWVYESMTRICRENQIRPLFVLQPLLEEGRRASSTEKELASRAGFLLMDLSDVYAGIDRGELRIRPWDHHPNERGHRLVADLLFQRILAHRDELAQPVLRRGEHGR